ncbi:SUMF1/EgtB/PvdO family nonheme iron enzyme [Devosia oryziradicis]|uniref:SUMF1/EgtB/PvdO family nonheme iron enzyme n=1 Tax=Devosia oryziradicis TaxID=2801335 RepID=A0ABX7BW86_9HYPH|nr:SUMF1/EgtB/PvdO family nonheme iron enzyme [Devosia oryziradicis]QQR36210.1 SUMF1/EgtB/PvdO family nonheme iron enzyme [Devosia oryziradicis]
MRAHAIKQVTFADLLLPTALLAGLSTVVLVQTGMIAINPGGPAVAGPQTVTVEARAFDHRMPGDFQLDGAPVNGTMLHTTMGPIEVMRYQVTLTEYRQCVADGACDKPEPALHAERDDVPVTGVSYSDAVAYAEWLSDRTGDRWRLPTVDEWIFIAGDRAVDHAVEQPTDATNPAARWLAAYEQEAGRAVSTTAVPQPTGAFGANDLGVMDLGGNVWEWTATCVNRTTLDPEGGIASVVESCGVHYLEGRHLTPMSVFVRDARGGGCSVGAPPDNLGFRLVREPGFAWPIPFLH